MARLSRPVRREPHPSAVVRTEAPDAPPPHVPRWLLGTLALVCAVLLLLDLTGLRYGYLAYEKAFGGYALTAFAAALAVLALAALLRPLLARRTAPNGRDNAYGRDDAYGREDAYGRDDA